MTVIFSIMLPILILIGVGFIAVRSGLINEAHVQGLGAFVLNFALPAVLVSAMVRQDLTATFNVSYVAAYGLSSLVAFFLLFAVLRGLMRRPLDRAAMGALGGAMSNTGFIGFPVASLAFGTTALAALPMTMLVENVLILPIAFALVEIGAGKATSLGGVVRETAARLIRMPLMLAIIVGLILALSGITLPAPLLKSMDMLASASAPTALFVVGGTIALLKRADMASDIGPIVAGKLLIHPLATTAAMMLIPGIPAELQAVGILLSSVSMITVYPILAKRAGMDGIAAAALICATSVALVTISVVLFLLAPAGAAG